MARVRLPPPVRLLARVAAALTLGVVLCAVLLLVALQADGVGTAAARWAADRWMPEGSRLEPGRVSGSWLGGLTLVGARAEFESVGLTVRIDTLRAGWRPWRWRRRTVRVDDLLAAGVEVEWRRPEAGEDRPARPSSGPSWSVEFDAAELRRVDASLEGGEGAFRVSRAQAVIGAVRVSEGLSVGRWDLDAVFSPADHGPEWGTVRARGSLEARLLTLDTVDLRSPRSRVTGSGEVPLDARWAEPGRTRWRLDAAPLVLADLRGLTTVPAVLDGDTLQLTSWATPEGDSARVHVDATSSAGGRARVELRWGRSGDSWGGAGEARVEGVDPARFGVEAVPAGALSLEVDGTVEGVAAAGAVRSGEAEARLRISGASVGLVGRMRATRVGDADTRVDSAEVVLEDLRWQERRLEGGRVAWIGGEGLHRWTADLRPADGGRVRGDGTWREGDGGGGRWEGRLVLDDVVDRTSRIQADGAVIFEGVGAGAAGIEGRLRAELGPSRLGEWPVDTLSLVAEGTERRTAVRGRVAGARGAVEGEGWLGVRERGGDFALRSVRFEALDVFPPVEAIPLARPSGRLTGEGSWRGPLGELDASRLIARGELDWDAWSAGELELDSAHAVFALDEGRLDAHLRAVLPGGAWVEADVEGPVAAELDLAIRDGRFGALDLASVRAGLPATVLSGDLEGSLLRSGEGPFNWGLVSALDEGRVGPGVFDGGVVQAEGRAGGIDGSLELRGQGGGLRARAGTSPGSDGEPLRWWVDADADLPEAGSLVGREPTELALSGSARVEGGNGTTRFSGRLGPGAVLGGSLDSLLVAGRLAGGVLGVDTLRLRSDVADADGAGRLPMAVLGWGAATPAVLASSDAFRLDVRVHDEAPALLLGSGRTLTLEGGALTVESRCAGGACRIDGGLELGPTVVGSAAALGATGEFHGRLGPDAGADALTGEGSVEVSGIRLPSSRVERVRAGVRLVADEVVWTGAAEVDENRDAGLTAVMPRGSAGRSWSLEEAHFRHLGNRWTLTRPARLDRVAGGWTLDSLEMTVGGRRVAAAGTWAPGARDFRVRVDSIPVEGVSDLLGSPGLGGWIQGFARAVDEGEGLRVDADVVGALSFLDRPLHRATIRADGSGVSQRVDIRVVDPLDRARLTIEGEIPTHAEDGSWGLTVSADSLPLAWVDPYLPDAVARDLSGRLDARLRIAGPADAPTVRGPVTVDEGGASLPVLGVEWTELRLRADVRDRVVAVDSLSLLSGGRGTAAGQLTVSSWTEPVELDLTLQARDFLAFDVPLGRARVDADLRVGGTTALPRVEGTVAVLESEIHLDDRLGGGSVEDVELAPEDWEVLQRRFGVAPPPERGLSVFVPRGMTVDLAVELGRDNWVRQEFNPEMAVQFTGRVRARKALEDDEFQLEGRLESISDRSYVEQFGRRFELEEGVITFQGPPGAARLDLTSAYHPPAVAGDASDVVIRMTVRGGVGSLDLALSSVPSMDNSDIVSYLATGRPASAAFSEEGSGSSVAGIGTELVAGELTAMIERFAMTNAGLDVVDIRRDGIRGATIVAGQYVTPKVFIGLSQPISFQGEEGGFDETRAEAEWQALRWLLVNVQTGGSAFRFFLEGSFGY